MQGHMTLAGLTGNMTRMGLVCWLVTLPVGVVACAASGNLIILS